MQSLSDALRAAADGRVSWTIGVALAGALLLQIVIEIFRGLLRAFYDRRQQRATMERLRLQVQEARLRQKDAEKASLVWNGCRKFSVVKNANQLPQNRHAHVV